MPTTGWSSCAAKPATCSKACSTSVGAARSSRAPSATSSCAPAWLGWSNWTSATRRSTSGASIASPSRATATRATAPPFSASRSTSAGWPCRVPTTSPWSWTGARRWPSPFTGPPVWIPRAWPAAATWRCGARTVLGLEDEYFVDPDGHGVPATPGGSWTSEGDMDDGERLLSEGLVLGGPGALLSALGQARTGHMGDIVATIQREQDEIIRSPLGGVLVVQGGPGTGKTAVALHRAAYLLYTHRFPLERQGVLVVGPNPLFLRYIEQVLPSLGETGVSLSTVAGLVPEVRVRGVDVPAVARLKGDVRMVKVLARAVRTRQRPLRRDAEVPFGAAVLRLRAQTTEEIVAMAKRRPGTHNARRRFVETQVVRALAGGVPRPAHARRCRTRRRSAERRRAEGPGAAPSPRPRSGRGAGPHVAAPLGARVGARLDRGAAALGRRRQGDPHPDRGPTAVPAPQHLARCRPVDRRRCRADRRGPHPARPPPRPPRALPDATRR